MSAAIEAVHLAITKTYILKQNHCSWLAAHAKVIFLTILLRLEHHEIIVFKALEMF